MNPRRRRLQLVLAGASLLFGLYLMLWFGWLSATAAWEEAAFGITVGFSLTVAWCIASAFVGVRGLTERDA